MHSAAIFIVNSLWSKYVYTRVCALSKYIFGIIVMGSRLVPSHTVRSEFQRSFLSSHNICGGNVTEPHNALHGMTVEKRIEREQPPCISRGKIRTSDQQLSYSPRTRTPTRHFRFGRLTVSRWWRLQLTFAWTRCVFSIAGNGYALTAV